MGAGRKPSPQSGVNHVKRPSLASRYPVHVTLRLVEGLPKLRNGKFLRALRRAFAEGAQRFGFRLVHYSIQQNHIHLIVEAKDSCALSRGMQGLTIRMARGLNGAMHRKGKVFAERYHARILRTPREVRNAIRYVLNNARRHAAKAGWTLPSGWVDPYSSGHDFDGWRERRPGGLHSPTGPPVTTSPKTWLLEKGWRRAGRIQMAEVPGPDALTKR